MAVDCLESGCIVYVLYQKKGDIENPSQTPKKFPKTREKSQERWGWISQYIPPLGSVRIQYLPRFGGVQIFSSSYHQSLGMDKEIHPCGQRRIDSLKINPSLLRMRE